MAFRIPWCRDEALILLEALIKVLSGECPRKQAVIDVSEALRKRATGLGIKIDNVFRNFAGISLQMRSMEYALTDGEYGLDNPSQLFKDIVTLYKNDRKEYEKLLEQAKRSLIQQPVEKQSIKDRYYKWLEKKINSAKLPEYDLIYKDIDKFCLKKKILVNPLFQLTDFNSLHKVTYTIKTHRNFTYKKNHKKYLSALKYYQDFLKELPEFLNNDLEKQNSKKNIALTTESSLEETKTATVPEQESEKAEVEQPSSEAGTSPKEAKTATVPKQESEKAEVEQPVSEAKQLRETWKPAAIGALFRQKSLLANKLLKVEQEEMIDPIEKIWRGNLDYDTKKSSENTNKLVNSDKKGIILSNDNKEIKNSYKINTLNANDLKSNIQPDNESETRNNCDVQKLAFSNWLAKFYSSKSDISVIRFAVGECNYRVKKYNLFSGDLWQLTDVKKLKDIGEKLFAISAVQATDYQVDNRLRKAYKLYIDFRNSEKLHGKLLNKEYLNNQRMLFIKWMQKTGVNNIEILSHLLYLEKCAKCLKGDNIFSGSLLELSDTKVLSDLGIKLFSLSSFQELNKKLYNKLSKAFNKYFEYRSKQDKTLNEKSNNHFNMSLKADPILETKNEVIDPDLEKYQNLLKQYFSKGFRIDSPIDVKKFKRRYKEKYENELETSNEDICNKIRGITILYKNKAYFPDSMLNAEKRKKLLLYIDKTFSAGCNLIYYSKLFNKFEVEFQGEHINSPDMLKAYLKYFNKGNYYVQSEYISKDKEVKLDITDELRKYLLEKAVPVSVSEICKQFSNLPAETIETTLKDHNKFIKNGKKEYFYADIIDFSEKELKWIKNYIETEIYEWDYITSDELIQAIENKYPDFKERCSNISLIGKRNMIAFRLENCFAFKGNKISSLGRKLSKSDIYERFCRTHSNFTLDQLNNFLQEKSGGIDFSSVYANSLRVSQQVFISRDQVHLDIAKIDAAIDQFCKGDYISLNAIKTYGLFPSVGYEWNPYLLESFVATFSQKYKLFHTRFNAYACVGAIVKKSSHFKDLDDVLTDVLSRCKYISKKSEALNYLFQRGYLAKRSYSNIEVILTRAEEIRGKKG